MNIKFYVFPKKNNSTKRPAVEATTYDCKLKDECSIMNPSIILNIGTTSSPSFNYAYIESFGRYYFIRNWSYYQGLWTAELEIDVLATWKTAIALSNLYVLRSASAYDGKIVDTTYPLKYDSTSAVQEAVSSSTDYFRCYNGYRTSFSNDSSYVPWGKSPSQCTVIMGVGEEGHDGVTFYAMPHSTFTKVYRWLLDAIPTGEGWTGLVDGVKKSLYKPLSYITRCYLIPSYLNGIQMTYHTITIGEFTKEDESWNISLPINIMQGTNEWRLRFDIPQHPLTATRGLYLNNAPYSEFVLNLLPFGTIELPASKLSGVNSIACRILLDIPTGNAELYVHGATDIGTLKQLIYHGTAKWGADIPVVQGTIDYIGAIGAAAESATGLFQLATGDVGNAIASAENGIGDMISSMERMVSSSGSPGSTIAYNGMSNPSLHAQFYYPVDEDIEHRGRPLCANKVIGTLSGFIKCADAEIETDATMEERDRIINYLTEGFFYE